MTYAPRPGTAPDVALRSMQPGLAYTAEEVAALCNAPARTISTMLRPAILAQQVQVSDEPPRNGRRLLYTLLDTRYRPVGGLPFPIPDMGEFAWPPAGAMDLANADNLQRWYA